MDLNDSTFELWLAIISVQLSFVDTHVERRIATSFHNTGPRLNDNPQKNLIMRWFRSPRVPSDALLVVCILGKHTNKYNT